MTNPNQNTDELKKITNQCMQPVFDAIDLTPLAQEAIIATAQLIAQTWLQIKLEELQSELNKQ